MKKTALIPIAVLLAFVAAEIAARFLVAPNYHPFGLPLHFERFDENNLEKIVPFLEREKDPKEVRVLVTGGSAASGIGADKPEHTFPAQLEKILQARAPGYDVRVFNAGVGSLRSASELYLFVKYFRRLKPDIVISFTGYNDIANAVTHPLKPDRYEELTKLDRMTFTPSWDLIGLFRLLARGTLLRVHEALKPLSRLYQIGANVLENMDITPIRNAPELKINEAKIEARGLVDVVASFQALARLEGFKYLAVIQPIRSCGSKATGAATWQDARVRDIWKQDLRGALGEYAAAERICVLDLNEALTDELIAAGGFVDICHLNSAGYRRSAEEVARKIALVNETTPPAGSSACP